MSGLQNHLTELIRGQQMPLPALDESHLEIILELLHRAYVGIASDYPDEIATSDEKHLNGLMVSRLNHLVSDDPLAGLLVRAVSRGTETKNFDATRFEMRPDIQISLTSRQHLFPLVVECKLIDLAHDKTVERYCLDGLARFTTGDYAWMNLEAMMLAYVRGTAADRRSSLARSPGGILPANARSRARSSSFHRTRMPFEIYFDTVNLLDLLEAAGFSKSVFAVSTGF
jgi:hypothetical protein